MGSAIANNLAEKFSPKVQESFKKGAFTQAMVNSDYEFIGVKTVKVYSVDTVAMTNYNKTGSLPGTSRYGTVNELQTAVQELTIEPDRSFSFVVDKLYNDETMGILNPGRALQRQIEERVIPEVDKYRIAKIMDDVWNNPGSKTEVEVTKDNCYEVFLDAVTGMMEKNVPLAGTFAYITPKFYKQIRLSSQFIKASDMAQDMLVKGQVGMIDGIPLILVPSNYFPEESTKSNYAKSLSNISAFTWTSKGISFMLVNRAATVGAEKLTDYKVHDNPPGVNGWLVEGRMVYDAFVLDKKKDMIHFTIDTTASTFSAKEAKTKSK